MIWIYLFVLVLALLAAFVAQLFVSPQRRARVIYAAAAGPSSLLPLLLIVSALTGGSELNWLETLLTGLFLLVSCTIVALITAIIGSELATLLLWLHARRRKPSHHP